MLSADKVAIEPQVGSYYQTGTGSKTRSYTHAFPVGVVLKQKIYLPIVVVVLGGFTGGKTVVCCTCVAFHSSSALTITATNVKCSSVYYY